MPTGLRIVTPTMVTIIAIPISVVGMRTKKIPDIYATNTTMAEEISN